MAYAEVTKGYLVIVSRVTDGIVWDYPLPIDLDSLVMRAEVEAVCKQWGVPMTQVRERLAEADKREQETVTDE